MTKDEIILKGNPTNKQWLHQSYCLQTMNKSIRDSEAIKEAELKERQSKQYGR